MDLAYIPGDSSKHCVLCVTVTLQVLFQLLSNYLCLSFLALRHPLTISQKKHFVHLNRSLVRSNLDSNSKIRLIFKKLRSGVTNDLENQQKEFFSPLSFSFLLF